jgi:hypothetical protein
MSFTREHTALPGPGAGSVHSALGDKPGAVCPICSVSPAGLWGGSPAGNRELFGNGNNAMVARFFDDLSGRLK